MRKRLGALGFAAALLVIPTVHASAQTTTRPTATSTTQVTVQQDTGEDDGSGKLGLLGLLGLGGLAGLAAMRREAPAPRRNVGSRSIRDTEPPSAPVR